MMNAERILEAVKVSGANKIALIDDAFDPPEFREAHAVLLLGFLEKEGSAPALAAAGLEADIVARAVDALQKTHYAADEIVECVDRLYAKFSQTTEARYDPGMFGDKSPALKSLEGLL